MRGTLREEKAKKSAATDSVSANEQVEVWPLRVVDFSDPDQFKLVYSLLGRHASQHCAITGQSPCRHSDYSLYSRHCDTGMTVHCLA